MGERITLESARAALAQSVGGEGALATSFSARTMGDLAKRAARELDDAADSAIALIGRVNTAIDAAQLRPWHRASDADLLARYVRFWAAYQRAGAATLNWMVTGPARFPVARNQKRMDAEHRRWVELDEFRKQAPDRAVRRAGRVRKAEIGAAGVMDAELADLQARHAAREQKQAMMRAINALIRKHKLNEAGDGPARLAELARMANHPISDQAALALLTPDCFSGRGFQSFSLSNNDAEIHRLAGRIKAVTAKLARAEAVEAGTIESRTSRTGDVDVIENAAEDRLQLAFPGKPSAEARAALKSHGFRWSPRNGAWQRQLTNNARYAAERVLTAIAKAEGRANG